jgi:CheY-like chemotaxis protein
MSQHVEILLVEDNPHDAKLAIHALTGAGLAANLLHLRDGQYALDFLFGTDACKGRDVWDLPKVVVLDLKLPKVDGLEVLRRIRADERTKLLPVAIFTSSRLESDVLESYTLGANSYAVKPVEFEQFSEAIISIGRYWLRLNEVPERKP